MYYIDNNGDFTYDELSISGARTCSISFKKADGEEWDEKKAVMSYEPFVEAKNARGVIFGAHIRAVEAQSVNFYLEYFDIFFKHSGVHRESATENISYNFLKIGKYFKLPEGTAYFKPGIEVRGKITALTFFYPFAYLSNR
ncbi:MAG: hypothetical protein LBQ27_03610 [Clostridiales bacterium]|jgi:hypothetical protein|nr:hypothetical protein [Clostridiales bacterium]